MKGTSLRGASIGLTIDDSPLARVESRHMQRSIRNTVRAGRRGDGLLFCCLDADFADYTDKGGCVTIGHLALMVDDRLWGRGVAAIPQCTGLPTYLHPTIDACLSSYRYLKAARHAHRMHTRRHRYAALWRRIRLNLSRKASLTRHSVIRFHSLTPLFADSRPFVDAHRFYLWQTLS